MNIGNLSDIINTKEIQPVIVNDNSNFVVVTYWWGRDRQNQNTARPCISFFEGIINQVQNLCLKILGTASNDISIQQIFKNLEKIVSSLSSFKKIIDGNSNSYNQMIFDDLELQNNQPDSHNNALIKLEKMKTMDKTPEDFEYKNKEYTVRLFTMIMIEMITLSKKNYVLLFDTNKRIKELKEYVLSNSKQIDELEKKRILAEIKILNQELNTKKEDIKKLLKQKQNYSNKKMKEFNNMSIYEILHDQFRFLNPMNYETMIEKWQRECEKFNCNHMAVEYPEFALPGGYQLAINAKPLFIKKALEACGERSVLYIDGDMFIRKYPKIFDIKDVDFMARGWWIDPRSSWKMEESITYDPYTFETSGGTMMFSQSNESKQLISKWVEEASKPHQVGKADDRILSLVFNTYKFLTSLKVIQLPIEYLWLTLDYDDRMLDMVYDYNKYKMDNTIIIEHSECLTSEDTASGSGAASDRTPKFYGYLEENIDPVSEQFHEYIMFPTKDMVEAFQSYLEYMQGVQYINDGNEILLKKGFVNLENPDENEQPLYITSYDNKYGNIKYPHDNSLTYNDVAAINTKRSEGMNIKGLALQDKGNNTIEINNFSVLMKEENNTQYNHSKIISLIIKLLKSGKEVIYNPVSMDGYDKGLYDKLIKDKNSKFESMEFIFAPDFTNANTQTSNYFYRPLIKTNQAMFFKPSDILIKFLTMFLSLDDLSMYINYGSYEFMSRVRVGYVIKDKTKKSALTGGNNSAYNAIELYNQGIEMLYKGGKFGKTRKNQNHTTNTLQRRRKRSNNKNITLKKRKISRKTRKLKLNQNKNKNKNRKTFKKNKNRYSKRK